LSATSTALAIYLIGGNVSVQSNVSAVAVRLRQIAANSSSVFSFVAIARKKWEDEAVQSEDWTLQSPANDPWTPQGSTSATWSVQGDTSETWNPQSATPVVWSEQG
jgi:hypothetical protein